MGILWGLSALLVAVICHHLQLSSRLFHGFISVFSVFSAVTTVVFLLMKYPQALLNSYILQYLPTSQNSAAIISYFAIKIFFRYSGSSNLLFLLCYSEWEFFLLQGLRDFPNKQAKMSVENCKNEKSDTFRNACYFSKCPTFYSACYSSKFTISPSFKKLFSELERVILPSFFSEL